MLLPGVTYELSGLFVGDVVALGQRNVRDTTYRLTPRTAAGCVIVELTERDA